MSDDVGEHAGAVHRRDAAQLIDRIKTEIAAQP